VLAAGAVGSDCVGVGHGDCVSVSVGDGGSVGGSVGDGGSVGVRCSSAASAHLSYAPRSPRASPSRFAPRASRFAPRASRLAPPNP
jgi:hypothetical protein